MIQKNRNQSHHLSFIQQKQLTQMRAQNQRLSSELSKSQQEFKKLQGKYQKSLKQLALIVKANQNLKKDYDQLQLQIDNIVQQKAQISRAKIKEYIKKEIDDLNQTIQKLNNQKDQLELQNNSLKVKVKNLTLQKSKILNEKQQIQKKYNILESQLEDIVPETRDTNLKNKSLKDLRQKARLVDELQDSLHKLQDEKQSIQKDFDQKLKQIEQLWHQWYQFQHQTNPQTQNNQIKLHELRQQILSPSKAAQHTNQRSPLKRPRRKGSIIYQHGIQLMQDYSGLSKSPKKQVHFNHQFDKVQKRLQITEQKLFQIQKENQKLKIQTSKYIDQQRNILELKQTINKIKEQKLNAEQKLSQLRIQIASRQAINTKAQNKDFIQTKQKQTIGLPQQDLISILRDLHSQLGPLRSQLLSMKKQQFQQTQITSTEKANSQVKVIRLQKELSFYKQHNDILKKQLLEMKSQKQLVIQYQQKINQLQTQKSSLQGKLIVMQTLKIADRTRVSGETYSSLKEFEKRMQILAQDSTILKDLEGNHLQQLIAMKAYLLQLDERLKMIQSENQRLSRKYSSSKEKISNLNSYIKQLQSQQATKLTMYKQKIHAYDKLVNKLTTELERNIVKNNRNQGSEGKIKSRFKQNRVTNQEEFNRVVNLYEEKMINMGEEILRIRKDRDDYEAEVKDLRSKLNAKIKQLNHKQREIIILKTQNINLNKVQKNLEKQISQLQALNQQKNHHQENQSNHFQKSKFTSTVQQQKQTTTFDNGEQIRKIRQNYDIKIQQLQFQLKNSQVELNKIKQQKQQLQHNDFGAKNNAKQMEQQLRIMRQDYEKQQLQSIEILIQKHSQVIETLNQKHFQELQQKNMKINQMQQKLIEIQHNLSIFQGKIQEISNQKDFEIHQLQEVILKNNQEINQLRNQHLRSHYFTIDNNNSQTSQQYLNENLQLQNDLYQKNVQITTLQSRLYNLNLANQRLTAQNQILQQKLTAFQKDHKMKNSQIFHLQNQVRSSNNMQNSTIMAKDSLIRSYENEIKNLKHTIQDLKSINKLQRQNQQRVIRQLKSKLRPYSAPQNSMQAEVNISSPQIQLRKQQITKRSEQLYINQKRQGQSSLQSGESIEQSRQFIYELQSKIENLQSQLKYTQEQLLASSQQLNRLNFKQDSLPGSSSVISANNEQSIQFLEGQVFNLRTNILSLKNEMEHKEQIINDLKQEIYNLKLQRLKQSDTLRESNTNRLYRSESQDQSTSPRRSPIHTITVEPIIAQLQNQVDQLRSMNEQLLHNDSQQNVKINLLNQQIQRLTSKLQSYQSVYKENSDSIFYKNEEKQENTEQERFKNIPNATQEIVKMQEMILQLKKLHRNEMDEARQRLQQCQNELITKNLKIQELTKRLTNHSIDYEHQPQKAANIDYLVGQIQRQGLIILQKDVEITDLHTLLTKYQSQEFREKQNLSLIFLLMVQIQALRYQLHQLLGNAKKQQSQEINNNKIKPIVGQTRGQALNKQIVNYGLIKNLQCSHTHLAKIEKILLESQAQNNKMDPKTQTIVKSNQSIENVPTHRRTSSIEAKHSNNSSLTFNKFDEMQPIEAVSFPSQNNNSVNKIDSNYSLKDPFKNYYRHAQSTYNTHIFSPSKHRSGNSQLSEPAQIGQRENLQNVVESNIKGLNQLGKISESHNVQSSYGSAGMKSSEYVLVQGQNSQAYNYNLKNVNMIQSVNSSPNKGEKNQESLIKQKDHAYNYSFGKPTDLNQPDPFQNQIESRYIVEKRIQPTRELTYGAALNYSCSYLQRYPIEGVSSPKYQTVPSDSGSSPNSHYVPRQTTQVSSNGSQKTSPHQSSDNYIPTYNQTQSYSNFSSDNSQSNLNSTLENTYTPYKKYVRKFV